MDEKIAERLNLYSDKEQNVGDCNDIVDQGVEFWQHILLNLLRMEKTFGKDSKTTLRAQSDNYQHTNQDDMIPYTIVAKIKLSYFPRKWSR